MPCMGPSVSAPLSEKVAAARSALALTPTCNTRPSKALRRWGRTTPVANSCCSGPEEFQASLHIPRDFRNVIAPCKGFNGSLVIATPLPPPLPLP